MSSQNPTLPQKTSTDKADIWKMPVAVRVNLHLVYLHPFSASQYKQEWEEEENPYLAGRARKNWY